MHPKEILSEAKILYSRRKTLGIEIKPDGEIVIKVPKGTPKAVTERFVTAHTDWINKNLHKIRAREEKAGGQKPYSAQDIKALTLAAQKIIPPRVAYFAEKIGVSYGTVTIRCQKTRWGSCSAKVNLNFNRLLADMPAWILDSVVAHELCHRKFMNHSRRFYSELKKAYPDYARRQKWLKENGALYLQRAGKI